MPLSGQTGPVLQGFLLGPLQPQGLFHVRPCISYFQATRAPCQAKKTHSDLKGPLQVKQSPFSGHGTPYQAIGVSD